MKVQGGPTISRKEHPIKVAREWKIKPNKYLEEKNYEIDGVTSGIVTVPTRIHT